MIASKLNHHTFILTLWNHTNINFKQKGEGKKIYNKDWYIDKIISNDCLFPKSMLVNSMTANDHVGQIVIPINYKKENYPNQLESLILQWKDILILSFISLMRNKFFRRKKEVVLDRMREFCDCDQRGLLPCLGQVQTSDMFVQS